MPADPQPDASTGGSEEEPAPALLQRVTAALDLAAAALVEGVVDGFAGHARAICLVPNSLPARGFRLDAGEPEADQEGGEATRGDRT